MKITILGSGTCVPSLERKPCSVLVEHDSKKILIDLGPGIIGQILKTGTSIDQIDMIFLSHFHVDHCADLVPFIFATKYPGLERIKPLTLVAGKGIELFFSRLDKAYQGHLEMPEELFNTLSLKDQGSSGTLLPGLEISWIKPAHKPESRSFRITDAAGYSFVYTGDTDECDDLIGFARDADLMICESAMPDEQKVPGHLTPSLAGELAQKAKVDKLVLTHFYPECDRADIMRQCRGRYSGQIVIARDLLDLEV